MIGLPTVLTSTVHHCLKDNVVESCMVGGTHWEARSAPGDLPGATPTFFFAPAQIEKRNKEWGPGVLEGKAIEACFELTRSIADKVDVRRVKGTNAISQIWLDILDNKVPANQGIMVSIDA